MSCKVTCFSLVRLFFFKVKKITIFVLRLFIETEAQKTQYFTLAICQQGRQNMVFGLCLLCQYTNLLRLPPSKLPSASTQPPLPGQSEPFAQQLQRTGCEFSQGLVGQRWDRGLIRRRPFKAQFQLCHLFRLRVDEIQTQQSVERTLERESMAPLVLVPPDCQVSMKSEQFTFTSILVFICLFQTYLKVIIVCLNLAI